MYVITSLTATDVRPGDIADLVQGLLGGENRLCPVRDVIYDEDRHQLRTGHGPAVMAVLCNTAISAHRVTGTISIAAALRRHANNEVFSPAASGHGGDDEGGGGDVADPSGVEGDVAQGSVVLEDGVAALGGRAQRA